MRRISERDRVRREREKGDKEKEVLIGRQEKVTGLPKKRIGETVNGEEVTGRQKEGTGRQVDRRKGQGAIRLRHQT